MIRRLALFGLLLVIASSLLAPLLTPYDPLYAETGAELKPPSLQHLLGTDWAGRDVLSRVLYGGRLTLAVAGLAVLLSVIPGLLVGLIAGYIGGWLDRLISVLLDALLSFPGLLIALTVVTLLGSGAWSISIAVSVAGFPSFARVSRAAAISIRNQPYIEAARALGATTAHILLRHVLPNMLDPLLSFATVTLSWAIVSAATLHFLGFGDDPATPEWGSMLAEARNTFRVAVWAAVGPGVAIMLTLLCVNALADQFSHRKD